jgi:hypothetical protein
MLSHLLLLGLALSSSYGNKNLFGFSFGVFKATFKQLFKATQY